MYDIDQSKIKKILVFQPAFLGDVITATPLPAALRQYFPNARIDMLCIPGTKGVWEDNPYIDNILMFDKKSGMLKKIVDFFIVMHKLRKIKYDCVFALQGSRTSALLLKLAKIPVRIGRHNARGMSHQLVIDKKIHARKRHLMLLQVLTDIEFDDNTNLFWKKKIELEAKELTTNLRKKSKYLIGFAPGSVWRTKCWPEKYWIELIKLLMDYDIQPILFGGKNEVKLCNRIAEASGFKAVNLCGKLSIQQSAATIEKLDLMVTNDSAPLHIANAVNTQVCAFFGPTVKRFGFYPYRPNDVMLEIKDLPCRPCHHHGKNSCPKKHFKCMLEQKPEIIKEKILGALFKKMIEY